MRKAALITGILFALIAACSPLLILANFPGYGLLRVAGTALFCLIPLPLQVLYNLRRNENGLRRTTDVLGLLGMWLLLLGLLFNLQMWPGAFVVLLGGIVILSLFGVLFIASSMQKTVTTEWFNGFTAASILIVVSLGVGLGMSPGSSVDIDAQIAVYELKAAELSVEKEKALALINVIDTSTVMDSADRQRALNFYTAAMDASDDIEVIKKELVVESNREVAGVDEEDKILYPEETQFTTWFMVGEDVTNPTGKGVMVFENLRYYENHVLPESIEFDVPTSRADVVPGQWVKDNFYHATVMEAETRMTQTQIAIQKSIVETLESKAYTE